MDTLNKLIESIEKGNIFITILIIVVALIFNYKNIIEFLDSRRKVKISKLEDVLKSDNIKGLDRELLESELLKEQFKSTIGLNVEKEFREAIIKSHQSTNGEIRFVHFQRALPHFKYENKTLALDISRFEKVGFFMNIFLSIMTAVTGYVVFFYGLLNFSLNTFFPILSFSVFSFAMCIFFIYESRHVFSAKKILKELEK